MKRLFFSIIVCVLAAQSLSAGPLRVAAAISLKQVATDISNQYTKETGVKLELVFGSSGQLLGQIKNGAPIDLFISAGADQVNALEKDGLIDAGSRKVIAGNEMVLIVPADAKTPAGLKQLIDPAVKRIAIGEPKTVPAGQYAVKSFRSLKVYDSVSERLVYGANVRQVLDYVIRGEVEAGLVYMTDAKVAGDKVKVVEIVESKAHDPIEYPAVILKNSKEAGSAGRFLEYLGGEKAQATFREAGFKSTSSKGAESAK